MAAMGICRPSKSPWASPIQLVKKEGHVQWRICRHYRRRNDILNENRYLIVHIQDFSLILAKKNDFFQH